jgi:hypothetical protein
VQQEQSGNADAPLALETASSASVVPEELVAQSDKATVPQATIDAKDATPAASDAGAKRSGDVADDVAVSKAAKVDE